MNMTTAMKNEIKSFVQESVREVLVSEFAHLRSAMLKSVRASEMNDIAKRYKKPSRLSARVLRVRI